MIGRRIDTIANRIKEGMSIRGMKQSELVYKTGIKKGMISSYCSGKYEPKQNNIYLIAKALNVNEAWLMGCDVPMERRIDNPTSIDNVFEISTKRFPLLGEIACGKPRYTGDGFDSYVEAGSDIKADFCLKCRGDSMIGARINDGDIVFIREQPDVENGEIAAVIIGDEATLKRVNKSVKGFLLLEAANPKYETIAINLENLDEQAEPIRILGKAIAFQSNIV